MADTTLLTWRSRVTVKQLKDWIAAGDRVSIADLVNERFIERYFDPVNGTTNGFFIMARVVPCDRSAGVVPAGLGND